MLNHIRIYTLCFIDWSLLLLPLFLVYQIPPPQRSSMTDVPLLSLQGALAFNPGVDPFQNEDLIQMWLAVKLKPLLKSITKHFLSCLSTKNFSCSTYQTVYVFVCLGPHIVSLISTLAFMQYAYWLPMYSAGCGSSATISLRWIQQDKSGSTHSLCTLSCLETE